MFLKAAQYYVHFTKKEKFLHFNHTRKAYFIDKIMLEPRLVP